LIILSVLLGCGYRPEVLYADELNMYSKAYAMTDGDNGRILVGKQETEPMANASTTKILTCIVTLENCDLSQNVTISKKAASQPKVRLGMGEGEEYPLKDMLYGLMLESFNDCAVAIAEHVAGSVEAFSALLNEKAREIGCKDTHFITPNGLDAEVEDNFHHTTAQDLCLIMAYCTWQSPQAELFLKITQTSAYQGSANGNTYHFTNMNALLNQMEGVLSGKTGYTAKAGYCYVAAFERDGKRFCIALLACGWPNNKNWKWHDAKTLLNYGVKNYEKQDFYDCEIRKTLSIDGYADKPCFADINQNMTVDAVGQQKRFSFLQRDGEEVRKEIIFNPNLTLPIKERQILGCYYVYIGDYLLAEVPLEAEVACDKWKITDILKLIFLKYIDF